MLMSPSLAAAASLGGGERVFLVARCCCWASAIRHPKLATWASPMMILSADDDDDDLNDDVASRVFARKCLASWYLGGSMVFFSWVQFTMHTEQQANWHCAIMLY